MVIDFAVTGNHVDGLFGQETLNQTDLNLTYSITEGSHTTIYPWRGGNIDWTNFSSNVDRRYSGPFIRFAKNSSEASNGFKAMELCYSDGSTQYWGLGIINTPITSIVASRDKVAKFCYGFSVAGNNSAIVTSITPSITDLDYGPDGATASIAFTGDSHYDAWFETLTEVPVDFSSNIVITH